MGRDDISSDFADKSSASAAAPLSHLSSGNYFLSPTSPTYVNSNAPFYSSLFQNHSVISSSETASFDGGDTDHRIQNTSCILEYQQLYNRYKFCLAQLQDSMDEVDALHRENQSLLLSKTRAASETASFDGGDTDHRIQNTSCILEYQQLYNRYKFCLAQLQDSMDEVDALHRENQSLLLSNADLSHCVALLFSRDRLFSDLNRFSIASPSVPRAVQLTATQPLTEHNRVQRRNNERVTVPKSISVRTSGYLRMPQPGRDTAGHKSMSQTAAASQRMYVPAGSNKEEALELDVYNQGMTKTELCNKWEETGACPYGENCQFAHGIKELRPVIRHPRYKTEVCRMVLAGVICPYGHRCHFRHSLTEQERLTATPPPPRRSSVRIQH